MKRVLAILALVALTVAGLSIPAFSADTGIVHVTAEVAQVSVTVNPNSVSYGLVPLNTTNISPIGDPRIIAQNNGNCFVGMFIRGADTTDWALGTSPGEETYVHYFSRGKPPLYYPLTHSNQKLSKFTSYGPGSPQFFSLKMDTPTTSTATGTQSTTVTVMVTFEAEGIRNTIDADGPYIENVSHILTVTANVTDQNGNPVLGIPDGNFTSFVFSGIWPNTTIITDPVFTATWSETTTPGIYTGTITDIGTLPAGPYFVGIWVNDGSHFASAGGPFVINPGP
jgi:hypothetical protein